MLAIHSYRDIINSALLRFIDQENDLKYIDEDTKKPIKLKSSN